MQDPKVSDEYAWKPGPNDLNPPQVVSDQLWNIGRNGYEVPLNHQKERSVVLDASKILKVFTKNYDKRTEDGKGFLIQEIYCIDRRVIMQRLQRLQNYTRIVDLTHYYSSVNAINFLVEKPFTILGKFFVNTFKILLASSTTESSFRWFSGTS
jgi:hypothetical protein